MLEIYLLLAQGLLEKDNAKILEGMKRLAKEIQKVEGTATKEAPIL